jgi:hypothetical protein
MARQREPAPFRRNALGTARYLSGLGYSRDDVYRFLSERRSVTGWSLQEIGRAASRAAREAADLRSELSGPVGRVINPGVAGLNVNLLAAYRYSVVYEFGEGRAITVLVSSDRPLSQREVVQLGASPDYWPAYGYADWRARVNPQMAEQAYIVTFERRR